MNAPIKNSTFSELPWFQDFDAVAFELAAAWWRCFFGTVEVTLW
jgi:hypothetical protein